MEIISTVLFTIFAFFDILIMKHKEFLSKQASFTINKRCNTRSYKKHYCNNSGGHEVASYCIGSRGQCPYQGSLCCAVRTASAYPSVLYLTFQEAIRTLLQKSHTTFTVALLESGSGRSKSLVIQTCFVRWRLQRNSAQSRQNRLN